MQKAVGVTNKQARSIENRFRQMDATINGIFRTALGGVGALAGALSIREVGRYADAWTAAKNSLAVAGVVGAEQVAILDQLYNSAQRNSTPIGALADLYGKAAMSAKELGASQSDLVKFADGVALSLRVSGKSTQEASGALQQLGQLLGSSRVQAEEFNSIVDGAPTIMLAAANGIERAGGSVSKLKQLVNDGKISNRDYFNGILKGLPVIEAMAANTQQSIGQAMVKINNALTRYIGQTDESLSASQRLVAGLNALADNFHQTADAALKVAGVLAGALVGRAIGGMIAQVPIAASAVMTMVTALRAGTMAGVTLSASLGPIGLIAGAAAAAIYLLNDATTAAEASALAHESAMRVLEAEILNVDYASTGAVASTRDKIAADLDAATAALTRAAAERELAAAMASEFINPSMGLLPAPAASDAANTIANDPMVKDRQDVIDALNKQVDEIRAASAKFESYARGERPVPGARGVAAPLPASGGGASGGKGGGRDRKDEFEREVEKVTKRTAALQAETAAQAAINPLIEDYGLAVERAGVMQDLLTAAQEAGIAITPQLRAQMEGLAEAAGQATAASGRLAESQSEIVSRTEEMRDLSRDAAQGVVQDLLDQKSAAEAFAGALGRIGDKLLDMAFDSAFGKGGPFANVGAAGGFKGFLGGAIIPGVLHDGGVAGRDGYGHGRAFAPGTWNGARRYHQGGIAGLAPGEIPAILQRGEMVIPKLPSRAASGGGGTVDVRVSVDRNGKLQAYVERTSAGVAARVSAAGDARVRREVPGILAKHQVRNG